MSRRPRLIIIGIPYHGLIRGVDRQPIYVDARDYTRRLRLLGITAVRFGWKILCFVAMPNHDHLVFLVEEDTISAGMHYLNGEYAKYVNRRHDRVGHLFQGRYKLIAVEGEGYLFELCSYVHLNPVCAGLVQRPEDYPWSTYRGYIDASQSLPWVSYDILLRQLSPDPESARRKYRELVERDIARRPEAPWKNIREGFFLGSDSWVRRTKDMLGRRKKLRARPASSAGRIPFHSILDVTSRAVGIAPDLLLDSESSVAREWRPLLIHVAHHLGGYSHAEIATTLGYRARSSVAYALGRFDAQRPRFAEHLALITRALTH